jgi:hypothetical protein
MLQALKFGSASIRKSLRTQLGELAGDASKVDSIAGESDDRKYPSEFSPIVLIPAIIGEIGIPFDMKKTGIWGLARGKEASFTDYREPAKVRARCAC